MDDPLQLQTVHVSASGAVVQKGKVFPDYVLIVGWAKVARKFDADAIVSLADNASDYVEAAARRDKLTLELLN